LERANNMQTEVAVTRAKVRAAASFRRRTPFVAIRRLPSLYYGVFGSHVEKEDFNEQYVKQLTEGDPPVERHFTSYFGELVRIKLRRRNWSSHDIEDIQQETFLRVLQTLRQKGGLEHPERLGAFVNSVCNNIVLEFYRAHTRDGNIDANQTEPVDHAIDMHGELVAQERKKMVQVVLNELPEADRKMLRMVFWEDLPREEVCKTMNVDRGYLRVLLHRALTRFKDRAARSTALAAG
jgi:RNA polymerase sigma-70 factor, ECF subfamily